MEDEVMTGMEETETTDSFMDGWDDVDAAEPADQQEEVTEEGGSEEAEAAEEERAEESEAQEEPDGETAPAEETPKTWVLRYMDEDRTVGEAEMTVLAQKGMDYDRIRTKYDESKPVMELMSRLAREAGTDVQTYIADLRAMVKQSHGMSEAEAKRTVELEDREAAVAEKEQAAQSAEAKTAQGDGSRKADIERFRMTFPDAAKDPKAIPKEVWGDVNQGLSLVEAYSKYAVAQAQEAQRAAERKASAAAQSQKNTARATGSMKSAGESARSRDPFAEGFDS